MGTIYTAEQIEQFKEQASRRETGRHGWTDFCLYRALDQNLDKIRQKKVGVLDSTTPWLESVLLTYEALPATISSEAVLVHGDKWESLTKDQCKGRKFDALIALNVIEQKGLWEFPDGDLEAMAEARSWLQKDGMLFLSVPIGRDRVTDRFRIYGEQRLKKLFSGWRIGGYFGFSYEDFALDTYPDALHCPVFALKPKAP